MFIFGSDTKIDKEEEARLWEKYDKYKKGLIEVLLPQEVTAEKCPIISERCSRESCRGCRIYLEEKKRLREVAKKESRHQIERQRDKNMEEIKVRKRLEERRKVHRDILRAGQSR